MDNLFEGLEKLYFVSFMTDQGQETHNAIVKNLRINAAGILEATMIGNYEANCEPRQIFYKGNYFIQQVLESDEAGH